MAQAHIQEQMTHLFGAIPANIHAKVAQGRNAQKMANIVLQAARTSTFIDRFLLLVFEIESRPLFNQFMVDANIEGFMLSLERLRQKHYPDVAQSKKEHKGSF